MRLFGKSSDIKGITVNLNKMKVPHVFIGSKWHKVSSKGEYTKQYELLTVIKLKITIEALK